MAALVHTPASKKKASAKAKAGAPTLIEKMESVEKEVTPKKRKAARRDLDGMIDKLISDNFRTFTPQQIDSNLVDGLTLRESLVRDKELQLAKKLTMGKLYYQEKRRQFQDTASPALSLKVANPEEAVDDKLRLALVDLCGHRCIMQSLSTWLEQDAVDNQRTVVALFKACLDLKPESGQKHTAMIVDIMKWVVRNGIATKYPAEVEVLKPHFDFALAKSFIFMKRNGIGLDAWFHTYSQVLPLVVDHNAFQICMACKSSWIDIADHLGAVVNSMVGNAVFGKAFSSLMYCRVDTIIGDLLKKVRIMPVITGKILQNLRQEFTRAAQGLDMDAFSSFPKKMVTVTYRGVPVEVAVSSLIEQYNLSVSALIKEMAVEQDALEPLLCEKEMVLDKKTVEDAKVDVNCVLDAARARTAAKSLFEHMVDTSGSEIVKVMINKRAVLLSLDPCFKVEESFFASMVGEKGALTVQKAILDHLPTLLIHKTIEQSLAALENLGKSTLITFVGRAAVGQFNTLKEWLITMKNGRCPQFGTSLEGDYLTTVRLRLGFFCVAPPLSSAASKDAAAKGAVAIEQIFKNLEKQFGEKAGEGMSLADVRPLHIFSWMLTETQNEKARKMTDAILKGAGVVKPEKKDPSDLKKKDGKTSKKTGSDVGASMVDAYFG